MSSVKRNRKLVEQRERILGAARSLFSTKSPDEVTMADVAELAGVARATVFNHFSTKHALLEAITEEMFAYYAGMLEMAIEDRNSSTGALVLAMFSQMGTGIEAIHGYYRGIFREIAKINLGLDEGGHGERARERAHRLLVDLFSRGIERGDVDRRHEPAALASAFDAIVNGTIVQWLYDDATEPLRLRMLRAARIFLGPVAVPAVDTVGPDLPVLVPDEALVQKLTAPKRPRTARR
jgi:AcrR family transcriptional regulator